MKLFLVLKLYLKNISYTYYFIKKINFVVEFSSRFFISWSRL